LDLENKSFQKILFSKLAWISTRFSKVLQLALPHYSNRILKLHDLKGFRKAPVFAKRFHQNDLLHYKSYM
jgi:hypothetical protein